MTKPAAIRQVIDAHFKAHGWPIAGRDIERETEGKVSSLSVSRYVSGDGREDVTALGSGLYAPVEKVGNVPVPMSRNVALDLLAIPPGTLIDDHDHLRLFKVAVIMSRKGFAAIKVSRTTRSGIRRQTMRITVNDAGRAMLEARARLAKDEF